MLNENTDFFKYVDNFAKTAHVTSFPVFKGETANTSKVTIFIPTYKRSVLLKEAIDSALNQIEYDKYDIIVVDNNPERDDETEKLMLSYNDPRLSYYKNEENLGMFGNWNRGFELTNSEWVAMLHDDDLLVSNFLSESMSIIDNIKEEVGCLACLKKKIYYNTTNQDISLYRKIRKMYFLLSGKIRRIYSFDNYAGFVLGAPTGTIFNRRKVIKQGGFNPDYFPTSDFCFMVYFNFNNSCYLNYSELLLYRVQDNESLKLDTQQQFIINDYYLLSKLMRLYSIPLSLFNALFYYCCLRRERIIIKKWVSGFSLNIPFSVIKMRKYTFFQIILSYLYFKITKYFLRTRSVDI